MSIRNRFCSSHANEQRTNQAWSVSNGDRIQIIIIDVCFTQCVIDTVRNLFNMMATRHFRNNASKTLVAFDLGCHNVGKNFISVFNHGHACFITT